MEQELVDEFGHKCTCRENNCKYRPCRGECGCKYHYWAYQDYLSMPQD
ncbi:MAG: hypothetical protein M5U10_04875 [Candidatus Methanoperedens sp.]|nr:hypothetical protein [Candidatus Methanoperedens nitroreducens]MDJ1421233.1 hypothetical protein [Candidatus Methanoperedens sp.]